MQRARRSCLQQRRRGRWVVTSSLQSRRSSTKPSGAKHVLAQTITQRRTACRFPANLALRRVEAVRPGDLADQSRPVRSDPDAATNGPENVVLPVTVYAVTAGGLDHHIVQPSTTVLANAPMQTVSHSKHTRTDCRSETQRHSRAPAGSYANQLYC